MKNEEISEANFTNLALNTLGHGLIPVGRANFQLAKEHAKIQSTSFLEWIGSEGYVTYDGSDTWIAPHNNNNIYTANQLYGMFIKTQQK